MNFNTSMGVSSHMPVLLKLVQMTTGPILELGGGSYSTPLLHWICQDTNRKLVTYESDKSYFKDFIEQYKTDFHEVYQIDDWSKAPFDKDWEIVFIDHHPNSERKESAKRFANSANYIVLHDALPRWDVKYRYSQIIPLFKYKYRVDKYYPPSWVVSNRKEVNNIWT